MEPAATIAIREVTVLVAGALVAGAVVVSLAELMGG
jgi:hypothetical protein